ncbi:MAG: biotin--[acetyl-CoA-carboxylase] ligase [Endomicrobiales bacterium]|nr:biotin--[acetyl-CoA-carboxylase] ligase [Endomicrobiales bacterium]
MDIEGILSSSEFRSGEAIAEKAGISRAAVHKKIKKLRALGYNIIGERKLGYKLVSAPDRLDPNAIKRVLSRKNLADYDIIFNEKLGSTQTEAKLSADSGAEDKTIFLCEEQSSGYGRLKREWFSGRGGLWFSVVLRPGIRPEAAPHLNFVASMAVVRAVKRIFCVDCRIKWPNDVLTRDGKKLCGILTELSSEIGRLNWAVVGIGFNVNNEIPGRLKGIASSLSDHTGAIIDRQELFCGIIAEFDSLYSMYLKEGFGGLEGEYNRSSIMNGRRVAVEYGGTVLKGFVKGIDKEGFLVLKTEEGGIKKVIAGDVRVLE